jgi:hypothetical protein
MLPKCEGRQCQTKKMIRKQNAAELNTMPPVAGDIWPNWNEGVPRKLLRQLGSSTFIVENVTYEHQAYHDIPIVFEWSQSFTLPDLSNNRQHLPEHDSGIYRLFAPNKTIDRCCGKDSTGTLYLGCGGTKRNWSSLRTRVKSLVDRKHHAINGVSFNKIRTKAFSVGFARDSMDVYGAKKELQRRSRVCRNIG